jgi:hypothetical protein
MSATNSRKKMISLRLSEVEYEIIRTQYLIHGARNVSDLARLALQRMMNGSSVFQDAITARIVELEVRVRALESELRLSRELASSFLPAGRK